MNLLSLRAFDSFNVLALILVVGSFLWTIACMIHSFLQRVLMVDDNNRSLSAGKLQLTYQILIFSKFALVLEEVIHNKVGVWSVRLISASSFSRSFTASSIVATISLLDSVFELIEKLRPSARRLVSTWIDCLEYKLITDFFLFVMLVVFRVTSFLLISSSNFCNLFC